MIGRTLSHYRILEEISRGGMGVVYRALDLKLNREVALKVLPPELVADPDRKRRFILEAQAAAALKHPNIAVIYEIDEVEGMTFMALELIEGEKLRDFARRERLPLARALELVIEVADGLARAHDKGIVHRDLKPANIMVTEDGHAKIIDFGLAKLRERVSADSQLETALRGETTAGMVVGTAAYMSPEQARGQKVDHRSDIFSFGIVLYEILSGQLPFEGPSTAETLNAIIHAPTPELDQTATGALAPELDRILEKCLAKIPSDRYQTMPELLTDLRQVKRSSDTEIPAVSFGRRIRARPDTRSRFLAGVAVGLVAVAGIIYHYYARLQQEPGPRPANPVQITSAVGVEDFPAWGPDGQTLAFESNQGGNWDIWVTQVGSGQPLNRTVDHVGEDRFPSWSPDGRQIAFWSARDGGGVFVMAPLAGAPRKLAPGEPWGPPQWLAGGRELAHAVSDPSGARLEILSLADGRTQQLPLPGRRFGRLDLRLSSDGRFVAYVDAVTYNDEVTRLFVLRQSDGQAFAVTDGHTRVWSPCFSADGRALYFVSNRGGIMDLWRQRIAGDGAPEGEPVPVTTGIGIRTAAFSSDGSKLAYSQGRRVANVWRVPIFKDRPASWADAQQLTFDQAYIEYLDLSPDGKRLLVSSDRLGNPDLWALPVGGGEMQQLTVDLAPDWSPKWSPDAQQVAFYSYRTGNRDIWVMPSSGGPARQLTQNEAEDFHPAWSPSGREIAFSSPRGGHWNIWVVPAEGGEARQVTEHPADERVPQWSPDGRFLVFDSLRSGDWRLWRVRAEGGEPEPLTRGPGRTPRSSPDGKQIYFVGTGDRAGNLWALALAGRSERPLTKLTGKRGDLGQLSFATDGNHLLFTWAEDHGDLWVTELLR